VVSDCRIADAGELRQRRALTIRRERGALPLPVGERVGVRAPRSLGSP
jgi:hypothetical protein